MRRSKKCTYGLVKFYLKFLLNATLCHSHKRFYPSGPRGCVTHIISEAHTERLKGLLEKTEGTVVFGGEVDVPDRYVAPTLVKDVKAGDSLLSESVEILDSPRSILMRISPGRFSVPSFLSYLWRMLMRPSNSSTRGMCCMHDQFHI